eukprot:CAMPEP_0170197460 /NCGR_PEP_ID=MMETSP0040_2-20121228/66459_1 /TAXON_ID=641309 /ORGANISM="Lotharella oceanica, Strain CCMP622" /LENGTH=291 /DNA_ID=CAMNT_0010447139 /DNA_START=29 /DNA_END=904 /DNA_ORIENTATION=+
MKLLLTITALSAFTFSAPARSTPMKKSIISQASPKVRSILRNALRRPSVAPKATKKIRERTATKARGVGAAQTLPYSVADVGGTAPMGNYWDPLKLADTNKLKRFREAEITHGRLGMLGALGWLVQENFHPLFSGEIDGPAISHFEKITNAYPTFWVPVLTAIAVAELGRARIGWKEPVLASQPGSLEKTLFELRDEYVPGDLGFDPLGLYPEDESGRTNMANRELNNGRLAMLALAGFMGQELVNGQPIFDHMKHLASGDSDFIPFGGSNNNYDAAGDLMKDVAIFKNAP